MNNFKIVAKEGQARAGVLETGHGSVETPIFMPVGTQGSVKAMSPDDLKEAGAEIILGNTYHLYLRPGSKLIKKMGGLHKFMGWDGPILTDSGGFQAFSLGAMIGHGVRKVPRKGDKGTTGITSITGEGEAKKSRGGQSVVVNTMGDDIVSYSSVKKNVDKREKSKNGREVGESEISNSQYPISSGGKTILSTITPEGVLFSSHLDGSKHLLTPEKSIEVQLDLGADVVLVLDELLSPLHNQAYVEESLERTHDWEKRSQDFFKKNVKKGTNPKALLFGILQGVFDKGIREKEALWVAKQGFDGISIGGSFGVSEFWPGFIPTLTLPLSQGEGKVEAGFLEGIAPEERVNWAASRAIYETVGWVTPLLPEELPRHILGIGEVEDFFECIERGADMFDCVAPTRRARNGSLYISPKNGGKKESKFTLNISRAGFKEDPSPIDPGCKCYTCQNFSKSYLRHLYTSGEILYHRLATIHNVYFMVDLTKKIRETIIEGRFKKLKSEWLD